MSTAPQRRLTRQLTQLTSDGGHCYSSRQRRELRLQSGDGTWISVSLPKRKRFARGCANGSRRPRANCSGASGDGMGASTASLLDVGDDAKWQGLREYHERLYEAGYVALHWPKEWGGGGASLIEQAIYQDEVLRLGLPLYGANQLAIDRLGPTIILLGTEQQKERYLAQDADRRGDLVPGLLRAQLRLRPGGPADPRRARGRLLRGQRAEGLDEPRAARAHAGAAGAHRPRGAQAQGHLVSAGRHEKPRHHGSSADADNRRVRIQRSLLRQRARAQGKSGRRNQRRDGRCRSRP